MCRLLRVSSAIKELQIHFNPFRHRNWKKIIKLQQNIFNRGFFGRSVAERTFNILLNKIFDTGTVICPRANRLSRGQITVPISNW